MKSIDGVFVLYNSQQHQPAALQISTTILPIKPTKSIGNESSPIIFINSPKSVWKGEHLNLKFIRQFFLQSQFYTNRYPDDRPNIIELQNHPFFKQAKRTTLTENFSLTGIDKYNCTKLISGTCDELCRRRKMRYFKESFFKPSSYHLQMGMSVCRVKWPT